MKSTGSPTSGLVLLQREHCRPYIEEFNRIYSEDVVNAIPDREAWNWIGANVPLFECSERKIEEIYYFRWWIYRKHIKRTPDGFVVTEFLPEVRHGGKHNTINCPVGHQLYEGRWIKDSRYLDEYACFMLTGGGNLNAYSCWFVDGVYQRYCVNRDAAFVVRLLDDLCAYFREWEKREKDGLFHYTPWMDGMEFSISGNQEERFRPTFNSYMYGDALAIANVAELAGDGKRAREYRAKAVNVKSRTQVALWHPSLEFFATRDLEGHFMPPDQPVRELVGYIPWYFNLPDVGYETDGSSSTIRRDFARRLALARQRRDTLRS